MVLKTGRFLLVASLALLAGSRSGYCGPRLDEILNCIVMDQQSPKRDDARHCNLEPGKPVGQTFVTGDGVETVYRIAVWQAFWHETWQPDEALVMTLWDSPERKVSYGRFAVPYARRMWEQAVPMFTVDARVAPNTEHYFELTVETEPLRLAEIPREWTLAGKRPGFADGDGRLEGIGIANGDYPSGQAYLGGEPQEFDLWFQVHSRRQRPRDEVYSEAFGYLDLNYAPLAGVREAVEARDWDRAADRLVAHFEGREDLIQPDRERPAYDPTFDTREADLACAQKVPLPDGTWIDLGPNWNHFAHWPEQGGVGLTRSGLRKPLAAGYLRTKHEKYAQAFDDMLGHFFTDYPSPIRAGVFSRDETIPAALWTGLAGGSMWSGLSIGARMAHGFAYYQRFVDSPYFTRDVRAAFIINLGEMAEVLDRMKGGGNWETQMADSLFDFGLTYPEFKGAKERVEQGLDTLVANALSTVRPDGCLQEPSINYHMLVMGRYAGVIQRATALNLTIPDEMKRLTEGMYAYVMYSALPDGSLPLWGDANPPSGPEGLTTGADLFGREDFRFVATHGREGTVPERTSVGFPDGGFYTMRTGWTPQDHYLAVRCGPFGSHGHSDALGLIAAAYGTTVLIDPGVYVYGTPECNELAATRSHNTVTVDGADARSATSDAWATSERFDFLAGHNDGYRGLEGVGHHRRVWFLKPWQDHPALWLVLDDVTGSGDHEAVLRYRFADLPVESDAGAGRVRTAGPEGNLLVQVLGDAGVRMGLDRGIAAAGWEALQEVPVATFTRSGELPAAFTSLLVPFRGNEVPAIEAQVLPLTPATPGARAIWVASGDRALVLANAGLGAFAQAKAPRQLSLPDGRTVRLTGAGMALRLEREGGRWRPALLHAVRAQEVALGDRVLLKSDEPREVVDVVMDRE